MYKDGYEMYMCYNNYCNCSERLSVQECLNHPWLNTEELFQRSPVRKSRRSCGSEQKQKRKKLKKLQQQNGIADGELYSERCPAGLSISTNGQPKPLPTSAAIEIGHLNN